MKQTNEFINDMLDLDMPEASEDILWLAQKPVSAAQEGKTVRITIPFKAQHKRSFLPNHALPCKSYEMQVRAYGDSIVRITIPFGSTQQPDEDNVMLEWDPSLAQEYLQPLETENGWKLTDSNGKVRMEIITTNKATKHWSDLLEEPQDLFNAVVYPDGSASVPFMAYDTFYPKHMESVSLGYIEREEKPHRCMYSIYAAHDEKFAGTGERFSKMDLSGQTMILENTDGLGTTNRRAYKNIPFYVSSRKYGLFALTSAHMRLSVADISRRAVQGLIEDDVLDLFFIGGGNLERIVYNYRRITGFPRNIPTWSYGIWMSRMTYFSADETRTVAKKLREGKYPCDVIHLDTGWFKKDWLCEWEFNPERFPDPEGYMKEMEDLGFRISLWQLPSVARETIHYETAKNSGFLAPKKNSAKSESNFSEIEYGGNIDFSNPNATAWYQGLLERLLKMGASAIKTDFGEIIDSDSDYLNIPYNKLHNLYCLLYQKAAFEVTERIKGKEKALIWARAGWAGCQRYPVHWGGDCTCSWDGLASSIRGGLHLGVSGFAFWSHDVPGFHGLPDFMNNWPEDDLYIRWTQAGVFTSHFRYHGTSPREPYEYPDAAPIVRKWWNLRYALIPYIQEQGTKVVRSGYPLLRALIFHHQDDPFCWDIDDQYYFGDDFLVAPVMNSEGIRNVYLPEGAWIDFWTGELKLGPTLLRNIHSPIDRIPVYVRSGAVIKVYPEAVQSTSEMDLSKSIELKFDHRYQGVTSSVLGRVTGL